MHKKWKIRGRGEEHRNQKEGSDHSFLLDHLGHYPLILQLAPHHSSKGSEEINLGTEVRVRVRGQWGTKSKGI